MPPAQECRVELPPGLAVALAANAPEARWSVRVDA